MIAENTIWIYYDLWDYDPPNPSWQEFHKTIKPHLQGAISKCFVPQSISDSIWYFYEFPDSETKEAVIENLPFSEKERAKIIRQPKQELLDHWTK